MKFTLAFALFVLFLSSFGQSFAPPIQNPFSLGLIDSTGGFLTCGDIDGDGDLDILVSDYKYSIGYQNFYYFQNIGDSVTAVFDTVIINPS